MKLLQELMALHEAHQDYVFKDFDAFEPDGFYVKPFDVKVEVYVEPGSYSDHPYGEGSARENHAPMVAVEHLSANEDVVFYDEETGKEEQKRFKAGTELSKIPGYEKSMKEFFQQWAEEEYHG